MSGGARLLAWYDEHRRDLPWRASREPWPVWVSEIMLQQTRVETAIPYFRRFLERFPDPAALAEAEPEEVLAAWSGLGYYRRVRNLQAAAREITARGGEIPASAAELAQLPGIGAYTSAAIASISFGEAVPVLDGNVERLAARLSGEAGPVDAAATRRRLRAVAAELLVPGRPGDSNQALMELGATVCLPKAPRCPLCPLAARCRALELAAVDRIPAKSRAAEIRRVNQLAAVVENGDRLLLFRRPEGAAQLAGLWEIPLVEAANRAEAARRLARDFGGTWRLGAIRARIRHTITRSAFAITAHDADFEPEGGVLRETQEVGWFDRRALGALALTGATRKLAARLGS